MRTPRYHWVLLTWDGNIIRQIQPDGSLLKTTCVDPRNIKIIQILGLPKSVEIKVPEDAVIRIFDRVTVTLSPEGKTKRRRHFFGYNSDSCGSLFATVDSETGRLVYESSRDCVS